MSRNTQKLELEDTNGLQINPATEDKQDDIITKLTNGTAIQAADSFSIDAFGRWRTSEPTTIFDSKQLYDNQPLFWDDSEVSGASTTSTHSTDTASSTMGVALNTAGKRVRQTFMRFNYQPGKSQLILCTGVLDKSGGGTGITRGFGYYDDNNGLFLEDAEGTIQFVRRTSTSGSAVDNEVTQANWNLDTMDGNGTSGITLDFAKTQILFIDFEWLGVGRVRMGFVIDGKIYYAHEFNNANNLDVVYISTPNLPLRYEIDNDGTGAASTLEHICASVMSEGGIDKLGILRNNTTGAIASLSAGTRYAVMSGRLKSTHLGVSIDVENVGMIGSANDQLLWQFFVGGSVAGTYTFSDYANSAVQIAEGSSSNTHSGGTEIDGGFITTEIATQFQTPSAARLGAQIDDTPQEWHLCVTPITNNITVRASVTWRELL